MDGLYAEASVKKKKTVTDHVLKFLLIAVTVITIGTGLFLIPIVLMLGVVFVVLSFILLPSFDLEYEYVFCDGQVDFDKISGGNKRKTMLRADFDNMVVVAPKNSHTLDGYRRDGVIVKDFSSQNQNAAVYGMVLTNADKKTLVYFEPTEKMLGMMKQKAPRKIVEA